MTNASGVPHNLAIQVGTGASRRDPRPHAGRAARAPSSITVSLKAGTYTFFCEVPGHRAAGMFGTLTVK